MELGLSLLFCSFEVKYPKQMNSEWCPESSDHCIICSDSPRNSAPVTDSCLLALNVEHQCAQASPKRAPSLYTTQLSDTCKLKLANWKFLGKGSSSLFVVGACCVLCNSDLIRPCCYCCFPMAGHWPVIVAGGRAGAPDSSIGVLYCIDIIVAICSCSVASVVVPTQLPLALPVCDGLFPIVALSGVVSLSKILKSCHIPGLMLVIIGIN